MIFRKWQSVAGFEKIAFFGQFKVELFLLMKRGKDSVVCTKKCATVQRTVHCSVVLKKI
jgi:hypothetical protein